MAKTKSQDVKHPVPTKKYWSDSGSWKCVCTTPTHMRGQRFTEPQCSYCIRVRT